MEQILKRLAKLHRITQLLLRRLRFFQLLCHFLLTEFGILWLCDLLRTLQHILCIAGSFFLLSSPLFFFLSFYSAQIDQFFCFSF